MGGFDVYVVVYAYEFMTFVEFDICCCLLVAFDQLW